MKCLISDDIGLRSSDVQKFFRQKTVQQYLYRRNRQARATVEVLYLFLAKNGFLNDGAP